MLSLLPPGLLSLLTTAHFLQNGTVVCSSLRQNSSVPTLGCADAHGDSEHRGLGACRNQLSCSAFVSKELSHVPLSQTEQGPEPRLSSLLWDTPDNKQATHRQARATQATLTS